MQDDYIYLIRAASSGACSVPCPQARASLQKLGYMTPCTVREKYGGNVMPHGMALTKKGQRRADEIYAQFAERCEGTRTAGRRDNKRGPRWQWKKWNLSGKRRY